MKTVTSFWKNSFNTNRRVVAVLLSGFVLMPLSSHSQEKTPQEKAPQEKPAKDSIKSTRMNEIMVFGASRRLEKITEAPAAVSAATQQDLERAARHGTLARTLEGFTGVDIMQSGSTDFIVNARGFNGGLNRRVLVLQDGRDASMPLLSAQEWNSFALPIDDFARIEFVRGPAAALYGANAFNGVLNMVSYAPREVLGTRVSILAGDYQTLRGDVRHAGLIGDKFSYKISLGRQQSRNFATRRDSVGFLEYPGLVQERRALTDDERNTFSTYGALRMDYDFTANERITAEFGYSRSGNEIYVLGLGRTFVPDAERPYVRVAYNTPGWNIQANWMHRYAKDTMRLMAVGALPAVNNKSGNALLDDSHDVAIDVQRNIALGDDVQIVAGVNGQFQRVSTIITTTYKDVNAFFGGVYGQVEWKASSLVKVVGSARFDAGSLYVPQFSPRVAVVISPEANHQFRLTAGRSFQRGNYSDYFRGTPAPPPTNFAALERNILDSLAVWSGSRPALQLGLATATARALGNENLRVEQNIGLEAGYKGVLWDNLFVTVDAYFNRMNDFITNFLPGINPNFPTWKPTLPADLAQYQSRVNGLIDGTLRASAPGLTTIDGKPTYVVSNGNIGTVQQYGVDVGINYYVTSKLQLGANTSFYGYQLVENSASQPILPNTSPFRANLSATYTEPNAFDVSLQFRYVEGFKWLAGLYTGDVPTYAVMNLSGGVQITPQFRAGVSVINLLDRRHYQFFGGTYLPRMATVKIEYNF